MEKEKMPGITQHLFKPSELLSARQIANYFGIKYRKLREQNPEFLIGTEPNEALCGAIDGLHFSSEGEEEQEYAEDHMFYCTEDEIMELLALIGIIDDKIVEENGASIPPTKAPITVKPQMRRRQ